jgi:hypothetical protein
VGWERGGKEREYGGDGNAFLWRDLRILSKEGRKFFSNKKKRLEMGRVENLGQADNVTLEMESAHR